MRSKTLSCWRIVLVGVVAAITLPAYAETPNIAVDSGVYVMDPNHATLTFKVDHLGLSTYTARFISYTSEINFDAEDLANSTVFLNLDPLSIRADYAGNYRRIYPDTPTETWDAHLAQDPAFFNANEHPDIGFVSTGITLTGENTGVVTGNLTMLGKTLPIAMDVTFRGGLATHPFIPTHSAIGFSARGSIKRSEFGLTFLLKPPFVGDDVNIEFEAEYLRENESN